MKRRARRDHWKRLLKGSPTQAVQGAPLESFADASSRLDKLSFVEPRVFIGDDQFSQPVCDFILALAVIYGDLRNLWITRVLLGKARPGDPQATTPEWGDYAGLTLHVVRLTAGLLDELLELIWKKQDVLEEGSFRRLVLGLGSSSRESWDAIETVAMNKKGRNSLANKLSLIRNQVGYHYYNTDTLREAFFSRFKDGTADVPLLSRGNSLITSRFYFADAALEKYLISESLRDAIQALHNPDVMLSKVRDALYSLVTRFLDARGGTKPWPGNEARVAGERNRNA